MQSTSKTDPGQPRKRDPLVGTLLVLTFTTGIVDAVSFIGLGRVFTANMTGNVVFVAFALAGVEWLSAERSLAALGTFAVGAIIAGRLTTAMRERPLRQWLTRAAAIESACLLAAAGCGFALDLETQSPGWALYGVIGLTAVAMGFRNATVLKLAVPDLKTTVLTLTITGMASDSRLAGGPDTRLARRTMSVVALFAGGGAGAWLLLEFGVAVPLLVMAACVIAATAWTAMDPSSAEPLKKK